MGSAAFDREEDLWPRRWAEAYLNFAAGEKRSWLHQQGHRLFPVVGWAERGTAAPTSHGNSVPRFHITWGTGPGLVEPFLRRVRESRAGAVTLAFRRRVDELLVTTGTVTGVRGRVLAPDDAPRGRATNRDEVGDFEISAQAVIVTSGGIGGDHDTVRRVWPERLGTPPARMVAGVPARRRPHAPDHPGGPDASSTRPHVALHRGPAQLGPDLESHTASVLPGPSSLWLDARGRRLARSVLPRLRHLGDAASHHVDGLRLHGSS